MGREGLVRKIDQSQTISLDPRSRLDHERWTTEYVPCAKNWLKVARIGEETSIELPNWQLVPVSEESTPVFAELSHESRTPENLTPWMARRLEKLLEHQFSVPVRPASGEMPPDL
jgi:hypothetical protein